MTNEHTKAIPEMSLDARMLADALRKVPKGAIIRYAVLNEIIGRDVQSTGRGVLDTARRRVLHDEGIVTEAVVNEGIKVLLDVEVVGATGESARRRIRRMTRTAVRKLTSVVYDALPNELKRKHNTEVSLLSVLAHVSTEQSAKKLEQRVPDAEPLPLAKTLEFFK
ncbi:MAG TPA: hypothetical protein VMT89_02925 [Candidatus Acidoferrales bacterium]|nr:hypothetical protein [Candidatus Acidoferrales bacterium]